MIMRDSTTASHIPLDTPVVAGYVDGFYAWSTADWALFPHAIRLTIATRSSNQADILDVENGNATPSEAAGWVDRFDRPNRRRPTIYCSRSAWPQVRWALGARVVDYWISTLDGTQDVPGAVAVQYIDVGSYDESIILDTSWVTDMTLDTARTIVWAWFPSILNRRPEGQSAVDYWAGRLASGESGEQVLTDFCATPEARAKLG